MRDEAIKVQFPSRCTTDIIDINNYVPKKIYILLGLLLSGDEHGSLLNCGCHTIVSEFGVKEAQTILIKVASVEALLRVNRFSSL